MQPTEFPGHFLTDSFLQVLVRFAVALGIGFLIGLERQHSAMLDKTESFAGIRTFIMLALLGFCAAFSYDIFSGWIFTAILLSVVVLIGISYRISSQKGDIGGTTEFAAIIAFLLGAITYRGYVEFTLIITVVVMVVLSAKIKLHSMIGKLSQDEMYAIVQFAATAILILPFLPDVPFGPYNVLNAREIGWVVILTSGLGFLGYMLIKFLDSGRGILITGILGGMVSSTMTTWIFAEKSRKNPELSMACATAVMTASSMMILRVLLWIYLFNKSLLRLALMPVGIMFFSSAIYVFYLYRRSRKNRQAGTDLKQAGKPLHLQSALLFGILYMLITLLVSYTSDVFGNKGIYISGAIAGLTDIDAISISVAKLGGQQLSALIAVNTIVTATLTNTIVKLGIAGWSGSAEMKKPVITGYFIVFVAAALSLLVLNI